MLKDRGVSRGITCVYSTQVQDMMEVTAEAVREQDDYVRGRARRRLGSLSTVTGMFGLVVAHAVLEKLVGGSFHKGA